MIAVCRGCPWDLPNGQLTAVGTDHLGPVAVELAEAGEMFDEGWHLTMHLHRKEVT